MSRKRKNKRGWVVDVDDGLYKQVSVKSANEGWKISTFLRGVLTKLVGGDELADAMLKQHMIDEGMVEDDE